jgi:methylmalonyl-CoA/ethylmalonyl-CoA epimerase|tara:strand:- start:143 stop:541 length:399 start_codon:yes stop_codon:yes gene_type:complete
MDFHHIGILVDKLELGIDFFSKFQKKTRFSKIIYDKNLGVKIIFFKQKEKITFELISSYGNKSPIANLLRKKSSIINHIAFKVKNLKKDIKFLKSLGCIQITKPKRSKAFNGRYVVFFVSPLNHVIELIEKK